MKEDLKNKIQGIKSTVKDAFNKDTTRDLEKDQTKKDFTKNVDKDKNIGGVGQRKVS